MSLSFWCHLLDLRTQRCLCLGLFFRSRRINLGIVLLVIVAADTTREMAAPKHASKHMHMHKMHFMSSVQELRLQVEWAADVIFADLDEFGKEAV